MLTAIFGTIAMFGLVCVVVWGANQIEQYMENENICEEFTVFNA